ncbi:MAG: hypothetical protein EHM72_01655, partial [Calditrichaeota bacterium]
MHRNIIQFVLLLGFAAALTATAGDISSTLQVTPQIKSVGTNTLHTVRWTTLSPINRRGVIAVLYPDNFDLNQLTMATTYDYTTMNGVLKVDSIRTVNYKGKNYKKVIVTRKDGGTNDNGQGNVGLQLAVVGNATNTGFYRLRLETYVQDANPFTAAPSDTGSTTFQITESITNFTLSSANAEPRAGEGFTVNVTNARDAEGKLADGIINIAFQTGSIADHTAPDGATKPVLTSIWVQDGSGSATQTCYRVEKVRLTGTVSGGTATATTGDINVKPGSLGSLTISDPPLTTTAGLDFGVGNDITVTAFDFWKNRKTDLSGFLYFEGSDPRALFDYNISSPFYFVGTESGVKTFSGEAFEFRTSGLQTFTAVMGSIRQTSRNIQVLAGTIKSFNFEVINTQTAGTPFELKVINAVDDFNNPANATVQPNFVSGTHNAPDGTQPLFSKITVQNGSGSAFQTLVLAESVQLVGQATASVSAITNSFNVLPTSLSSFKLTGQPSSVVSGAFFSNSITVTAYDAFENRKTNFSSTVTFSSTDTDSRVVLPAPTSLISGSYTFPGTNFKLFTLGNQKITATFGSISGSSSEIKVTGPNTIRILRVFTVDSTVSRGQTQRIVTMQVQNNGSDPYENYTATLNFRQGALSVNGDYVSAAITGTAIGAAQTINLDFPVDIKSTATLGSIILDGQINGFYKGVSAQSSNSELTDSWIVQQQANVQAQTLSVTPDTVSRGSGGIELKLRLANNIGMNNSADALINNVSFRFLNEQSTDVTTSFQVTADPLNPVRVAGNSTADLKFYLTSSTNAPLGRIALSTQVEFQDANIQQNRIASSGTLATFVSVDAPSLNITSITPVDQPTATLGQDKDFVVEMKVHNISTSAVNISLDPQKTYIRFIKSGREYISPDDVQWPTALRSGGTSIPAGSEGYIDFIVRQINAQVPTGNFTILGRVESGDGYFTTSDLSGAYGAIEIQSADDVVITKSFPSRPTVTVNDDTRPWNIGVVLINRGGSDVQINPGTSSVIFTNSVGQTVSGFNVGVPYLGKGDATLSGNEVDTLFFPVAKTGAPRGTVTLNPRVSYTVLNTSQTKLIEATNFNRTSSIQLQEPALLAINRVHSPINTLSVGRTLSWDIFVIVENSGEAALDFDIADVDSTWLRFTLNGQPAAGYTVQKPSVLTGSNSTVLNGGDIDSLRYRITANPSADGMVDVKAAVKAIELNREMPAYDATISDRFATIEVETPADVVYSSGTLAPLQVNPGKMVEFQLTVRNSGQADVVLNPEATTFTISDGTQIFSAELDGNYGTVVPGNGSLRLHFQQTYFSTGFALGFFEPVVQLAGLENSVSYQKELRLTGENVKVGQPGNISLDSLTPNVGEVTLGQTAPWYVNIGVTNNSGQTLKLKTMELVFSSGTLNVTSQFAIQIGAGFENGSDLLQTGNSGTVRATITSVSEGVPTGDVLLSARVVLVDPLESGALFEEQINNAAKVTVQTRAVLD